MNRAQRRRQEKREGQARGADSMKQARMWLAQGMALHKAQKFHEAESYYSRVLHLHPNNPEALHLSGLLAHHMGQGGRAVQLITQAIRYEKNNPTFYFNLGVVNQKLHDNREAMTAFQEAIRLRPKYVEAHYALGNVYAEQWNYDRAIQSYRQALTENPQFVEAFNSLGAALTEQGQWENALQAFDQALVLQPNHAEAYYNRANVLQKMGRFAEGEESLQRALRIRPGYAKAHHSLGLCRLWQGNLPMAQASFQQSANLLWNHQQPFQGKRVFYSKIKHDHDQLAYLVEQGVTIDIPEGYLEGLREVLDHSSCTEGNNQWVILREEERDRLAPSFNRFLHVAECPPLSEGALNPRLDPETIEENYLRGRPEILYVDNLLREDALARLHSYCVESTIWKQSYENGYIGTLLAEGFSSPLLLQISEELRLRFPRIFKNHLLKQAWAFKCDSGLKGLNIHADAAAVNVNFWITPDSANLDPSSGGLVVWDKEAPADWNFKEYNSQHNQQKILDFLQSEGACEVVVPYRCNRAIIFNSDLFHKTDHFHFKDQFEDRRINITLLYGNRANA